ncbi:DUF2933 domain-containing protein [Roseivivax sp. CAU 1753]
MDHQNHKNKPTADRLMHYGMMACCIVMLLPVAGFFLAGGTLAGMWSNAAAFAPLLLCVGAHLVMHKFMGKSCHSNEEKGSIEETPVSVPSTIPAVARNRQ